ncbi:hypothetical protein RB195_010877 [Necator americanus]|uniref:Uncharacterized protein n=1 Tax=Necator americanus TaxID=51031 RepID=A0ABR1CZU9_NECAM
MTRYSPLPSDDDFHEVFSAGGSNDVMKHFVSSSKAALLCLYCLALLILMAEYWKFMGDSETSTLPSPLQSVLYHNYCVHYNVIAPVTASFDRIGQILHVSSDVLDHRIIEQVTNWNAPVSMTVVLRSIDQYACIANFLRRIRRESAAVAQHLRAHLIFSKVWSGNCTIPQSALRSSKVRCEKAATTVEQVALYPANLARNVARMFSATKYIVITDYEHLFNEGFENIVRLVAESRLKEKPLTMLVYRIFEIDEKVIKMPRDKAELQKLYKSGDAVVFHSKYYPGAHEIDGLLDWFNKNGTDGGLFAKDRRYNRANWEPQFVSLWRIPFHDEMFPYQLRDNTVLRWEMCRAEYAIDILDDVFMFHKGIKQKSNDGRTWAIQKQNSKKFVKALEMFKARMDKEYPRTKESCPEPQR